MTVNEPQPKTSESRSESESVSDKGTHEELKKIKNRIAREGLIIIGLVSIYVFAQGISLGRLCGGRGCRDVYIFQWMCEGLLNVWLPIMMIRFTVWAIKNIE